MLASPNSKSALERLGHNMRNARLRRGITVSDLAAPPARVRVLLRSLKKAIQVSESEHLPILFVSRHPALRAQRFSSQFEFAATHFRLGVAAR